MDRDGVVHVWLDQFKRREEYKVDTRNKDARKSGECNRLEFLRFFAFLVYFSCLPLFNSIMNDC